MMIVILPNISALNKIKYIMQNIWGKSSTTSLVEASNENIKNHSRVNFHHSKYD